MNLNKNSGTVCLAFSIFLTKFTTLDKTILYVIQFSKYSLCYFLIVLNLLQKLRKQLAWYLVSIECVLPSFNVAINFSSLNKIGSSRTRQSISKAHVILKYCLSHLSQIIHVEWKFGLQNDSWVALSLILSGVIYLVGSSSVTFLESLYMWLRMQVSTKVSDHFCKIRPRLHQGTLSWKLSGIFFNTLKSVLIRYLLDAC